MIVGYNMQLTIGGSPPPTGGTYGIPFGDAISNTTNTATVAYNASASDLQSALNALTGLTTSVTAYGDPPNCTFIIAVSGVSWESGFGVVVNSLTPNGTITLSSCPVSQFEQQQVVVSGSPTAAYVPVNGGNIIWTANWTNSYPETESATDGDTVALSLANTQCVFTAVSITGRIVLPGSGNYTLSWTDPYGFPHSASIAVSGGASAVQTALGAFPGLSGNVTATVSGTLLTLTLSGSAAGVFVVPSNGASLYGGIQTQFTGPLTSIVTFTGIPGPIQLITGMDQTGVVSTTSPYLILWDIMQVPDSTDEVQQIAITGTPTDGTYTITWENPAGASYTTIALEYDASSGTVEAALQALFSIGAVTVDTTGESPNYTHNVRFRDFNGPMPSLMTVQNSTTGGTFTVTRITTGVAAVAPSIVATFNPWANPRTRSDLIGQLTAFGALCTSNDAPTFFWPHATLAAPHSYASQTVSLTPEVASETFPSPSDVEEVTYLLSWQDPLGVTHSAANVPAYNSAAALQATIDGLSSFIGSATVSATFVYSATYAAGWLITGSDLSNGLPAYLYAGVTTTGGAVAGSAGWSQTTFEGQVAYVLSYSDSITGLGAFPSQSQLAGTVTIGTAITSIVTEELVYTAYETFDIFSDAATVAAAINAMFSSPGFAFGPQPTVAAQQRNTLAVAFNVSVVCTYQVNFGVQYLCNGLILSDFFTPPLSGTENWGLVNVATGAVTQVAAERPVAFGGYLKCSGSSLADLPVGNLQDSYSVGGSVLPGYTFSPTGTYVLLASGANGESYSTSSLAWNATASAVQSAIRALPGMSQVTVTMTGSITGTGMNFVFTVTIPNQPGYSQLSGVINNTNDPGSITPPATNPLQIGGFGASGGTVFPWYDCLPSDTLVAGGSPGLLTDSGGGPVVTTKSAVTLGTLGCIGDDGAIYVSGTATSNKTPPVQVVTIMLAPISGTFTLSWVSPSSGTIIIGPLDYDASASDIQTAMPSGFTVIQRPNTSPNSIFVVFFNGYQGQTVNAMTVSNNSTSNGTAYSTVVTKTNPYADCIQNITISGPPTSGTYTISWVDPLGNARTTGSIPYNATASQVQAIVQATTGMSTVTVGLSASTPNVILQVTFVGLGGPLNLMTIANSTSGGTFAVSYLIFGNWDQQQIAFTGECVNPGGTFTISWKNASNQTFTTTALPWNATLTQIQTALRLLSWLASVTALGSLTVTTPSSLTNIYGEPVPVTTVKAISGDVELDMIGVPGPVNSVSINNSTTGQALIAVAGNAFTAALLRIDQSLNVIWAAPTQYPVIGLVIQPGDSTLFVLEDFSTYGAAPANNGNNVFIDSYNAATGALLAPRTTTRIQFTQDTETGAGVASVPVPVESASGRNALVS